MSEDNSTIAQHDRDSEDHPSLAVIFARALEMAESRLRTMSAHDEDAEFDRGARSAGTLVRTALQVNALQRQLQKDAAADAQIPPVDIDDITLTEQDLEALRADISAKLDRIEAREEDAGAADDPARSDADDREGGGAL